MGEHGVDLVKQRQPLLAKLDDVKVVHRLDIGFGAVNLAVQVVICVGQLCKVDILHLQTMDRVNVLGECFGEFMWCVSHLWNRLFHKAANLAA